MSTAAVITIIIVVLYFLYVISNDETRLDDIHDKIKPNMSKDEVIKIIGNEDNSKISKTENSVNTKLYYGKRKTRNGNYRYSVRIDLKDDIVIQIKEGDFGVS